MKKGVRGANRKSDDRNSFQVVRTCETKASGYSYEVVNWIKVEED